MEKNRMGSMSPNSLVRSSLEEMLDSLRQRDEKQKSENAPPALPSRPRPTSRARLPSAKRPLPITSQIGSLEDTGNHVLQGMLGVQKCVRGHHDRQYFIELKSGAIALQSYARGEIARKEYSVLLWLKNKFACKLDDHLAAVLQIQSSVRVWIAQRYFNHLQNSTHSASCKLNPMVQDVKDIPPEMLPSAVEELKKQLGMAQVTLGMREKENLALKEQVHQFEARCSGYESKMKSGEDMWKKQVESLKSLAAAKTSLCTNSNSQSGHYHGYDSDTTLKTPWRKATSRGVSNGVQAAALGVSNPAKPLISEFELRKDNFESEHLAIVGGKSSHGSSISPLDELRNLKHRFKTWKKDYKFRLREAKANLQRTGEPEKARRRWWELSSKR